MRRELRTSYQLQLASLVTVAIGMGIARASSTITDDSRRLRDPGDALVLLAISNGLIDLAFVFTGVAAGLLVLGGIAGVRGFARMSRQQRVPAKVDLTEAIEMVGAIQTEVASKERQAAGLQARLAELRTALEAEETQIQAIVSTVTPKGARLSLGLTILGVVLTVGGIVLTLTLA